MNLRLTDWVKIVQDQLASRPQESFFLHLPSAGMTGLQAFHGIGYRAGDPNSALHAEKVWKVL